MSETKLRASVRESCLQTTCSCPWLMRKWSAGTGTKQDSQERRPPLESRLANYLRYLLADATDHELPTLERLAVVRDRTARIREILRELEVAKNAAGARPFEVGVR